MFLVGFLVFLVAEIAAFIAVGQHIGFGWAVLLLLGVSAIGPFIVGRVGLGVVDRTRARLLQGELPTGELLDGVVVLIAGAMICVPGFISDAIGLVLMVRSVRGLLIRRVAHGLARRVQTMTWVPWRVITIGAMPPADTTSTPAELPRGPTEPGQGDDH